MKGSGGRFEHAEASSKEAAFVAATSDRQGDWDWMDGYYWCWS